MARLLLFSSSAVFFQCCSATCSLPWHLQVSWCLFISSDVRVIATFSLFSLLMTLKDSRFSGLPLFSTSCWHRKGCKTSTLPAKSPREFVSDYAFDGCLSLIQFPFLFCLVLALFGFFADVLWFASRHTNLILFLILAFLQAGLWLLAASDWTSASGFPHVCVF